MGEGRREWKVEVKVPSEAGDYTGAPRAVRKGRWLHRWAESN